jgi:hypothetical protein
VTTRLSSDAIVSCIRWCGALAALTALTALLAIGPPGDARAATATGTGFDQITGAGSTSSAVTVKWTQGLLDDNNQPIAAANAIRSSPSGPLQFLYQDPDFQNLQVTVSQTQDITHQGITVSWSGALQTMIGPGGLQGDFLQMMECYGDASSGPSPQDCEFGTHSQLSNRNSTFVGTRSGELCAVDSSGNTLPASTLNPPPSLDGSGAGAGCDPEEPAQGASAPDVDPSVTNPQQYSIPFVPVGGCAAQQAGCPAYSTSDTNQYFDEFNTNEVEGAVTGSDQTGALQFETLTDTESPGLGCGQLKSDGQPQNCWLVIVPRGTNEPNGYQINPNITAGTASFLNSSPLSASNWAMRIQIHLDYAPLQAFCPIGTKETETIGTELAARAVQSWQLSLNQAAKCTRIYGYSAVPEATSTQQLAAQGSGVGLAFTTIPIGSEAGRPGGGGAVSLPPILYAPVAVTATGFGFNISASDGNDTTPVKLSPELMAKALTQVYLFDLPDFYPNPTAAGILPTLGPAATGEWASGNPANISSDSQFQRLNTDPAIQNFPLTISLAPMVTEDHSALNQQVWQWIQADPGASAWLDKGTPDDPNFDTTDADPEYTCTQSGVPGCALNLGTPPAIDSFPRAYSPCLNAGTDPATGKDITRCSLDLIPYVSDLDQSAANILSANDPVTTIWNSQDIAPDGTNGWWDKNPPEPIGKRWIWGMSDTPALAAYGVVDAQLCSDSGTNCVGPSTASLTTALNSAKPDSAGLLQVDPANPGGGGYPLTQVVYAAVATNQSAADLSADADLIAYAAGAGQTPGVTAGDLPPGYLPMPASLQAQASAVVAQLRADAGGTSSPSAGPGTSQTPSGAGSPPLTPSGGGALSSPPAAAGPGITPPHAELAAQTTRPQPVGAVRWLLLAVVIAGAACAVSGTVLRSDNVVRWLKRMRA